MLDQDLETCKYEIVMREGSTDQWLTSRVNIWAVQRVTGNDFNVFWEMLLESRNLWSFAGCLATNNGTLLGGCRILSALRCLLKKFFHIIHGPY